MLVHSVYFWLKDRLTDDELAAFEAGLTGLKEVDSVRQLYVGRPVGSSRAVVDGSYGFALTAILDDESGLEAYKVHPLHKDFLAKFCGFWTKIAVYDAA